MRHEPCAGERGGARPAEHDLDGGVARRPWVERAPRAVGAASGQLRRDALGDRVDCAGEPFERGPERSLPAAVRDARALGRPAQDAVVAAPRRALDESDRGEVRDRDVGERPAQRDDVEPAVFVRVEEPGEEQVAPALVVAVQLAVGCDQHERRARLVARPAPPERRRQRRSNEVVGELIRVGGRVGMEGDGAGHGRVVQHHRDRPIAAEVDAIGAPELGARRRLPGGQDRVPDPLRGERPQRRDVGGRLGQPEPAGLPAEAVPEVGEAPPDLGRLVARRREGQDHVVVRLGDRVDAAICIDDPGQRRRILLGQPARQRRAGVEPDPVEVAALGVRAVALGRDAGVPVRERGRARIVGQPAAERVATFRLVEVAMDREAPAGAQPTDSSRARSRLVVTRWETRTVVRAPGARSTGQAMSSAEPW